DLPGIAILDGNPCEQTLPRTSRGSVDVAVAAHGPVRMHNSDIRLYEGDVDARDGQHAVLEVALMKPDVVLDNLFSSASMAADDVHPVDVLGEQLAEWLSHVVGIPGRFESLGQGSIFRHRISVLCMPRQGA